MHVVLLNQQTSISLSSIFPFILAPKVHNKYPVKVFMSGYELEYLLSECIALHIRLGYMHDAPLLFVEEHTQPLQTQQILYQHHLKKYIR